MAGFHREGGGHWDFTLPPQNLQVLIFIINHLKLNTMVLLFKYFKISLKSISDCNSHQFR